MAHVKATGDGGLAVDVAVKPLPVEEIQRLSFVKSPETPPDTPANDVNISGIQGKEYGQHRDPQMLTVPKVKQSHKIHFQNPLFNPSMKLRMKPFLLLRTAPRSKVSNEIPISKPSPVLRMHLLPRTAPRSKASDKLSTSRFHTYGIQGKTKPQDILPISTTQLEAKSDPTSPPAATEGYQDTVQTSPTNVVPPLAHPLSPATRFKQKLRYTNDLIVCPGVYDGLSARIAQAVGFETLYMTGAGSTASMLGMADLGIASRNDMVRNADMIANLDSHHFELIADMDTGYGGKSTTLPQIRLPHLSSLNRTL
ncbi:MAG: hypothetical protein Q9198_000573 [Flavoplaca austrocitrina]